MVIMPADYDLPEGHTSIGNLPLALKMFAAREPNPTIADRLKLEDIAVRRRNFCRSKIELKLRDGHFRSWGDIRTVHFLWFRFGSKTDTAEVHEHQCLLDPREFRVGDLRFNLSSLRLASPESLGFPDNTEYDSSGYPDKWDYYVAWYENINLDLDDVRGLFMPRQSRPRGARGYGSKWELAENELMAMPAAKRTYETAASLDVWDENPPCASQLYLRLGHVIRPRPSERSPEETDASASKHSRARPSDDARFSLSARQWVPR